MEYVIHFLHTSRVPTIIIITISLYAIYYIKREETRRNTNTEISEQLTDYKIDDDINLLNSDDKFIIFNFIGTGKQIVIDWKNYEFMKDNFFTNLVKYSDTQIINYNTDEDYDVVKFILQTIKYRKNIMFVENVSSKNQTLYNMLELIDKWSIEDELLTKYIIEKINDNDYKQFQENFINENLKLLSSRKLIYLNYAFECIGCKEGFIELTNHYESCIYHTSEYVLHARKWQCCGRTNDNWGCKKGYHIKKMDDIDLSNMEAIYNLSN